MNYKALKWLIAILIVAISLAFRLAYLDAEPFWVDEAESSINALTILEHGYPSDTYQGLPIYENTSVQPWPGNPEYAFHDVSYSDNHFAVYHGWLPLYSIAASFMAYGIRPDDPNPSHTIRYDLAQRKRRTVAGRMPAVLFGVIFCVFAFAAGKLLYGDDAAWAGLLLASIHPWAITMSRQARYYSAEILLTTLCCVLGWLMIQRGGWKHCIGCGFAFVLLFHTHLQSFFAGGLTLALATPFFFRRHTQALKKFAAFTSIVATGTIPWLVFTGFVVHQARIPRAWPLLQFPGDLLRYPPFAYPSMAIGAAFLIAMGWALLGESGKRSQQTSTSLRSAAPVSLFLVVWILCGYTSFLAVIPAVSFTPTRLNLSYWGPALALASIICAVASQTIPLRRSKTAVAPAIALALFFLTGHSLWFPPPPSAESWNAITEVVAELRSLRPVSQTRFYAAPNQHLIWTFYTGLPVQSMGPVRPEYLNRYPGDIVYIDFFSKDDKDFSASRAMEAAQRNGCRISKDSAEQWSRLLLTHDYRESILTDIGASPKDATGGGTRIRQGTPRFQPGTFSHRF